MKRRTLWIGIAALVVALVAATAAFATAQHRAGAVTTTTRLAAATPASANTAVPGACGAIISDPAAWKDMQALRDEHFKDRQAWWRQYGSDSGSSAAQAALANLRTEHWNDMRALLQKYGAGDGTGYGPGMMNSY